jgi:hypothetical protein
MLYKRIIGGDLLPPFTNVAATTDSAGLFAKTANLLLEYTAAPPGGGLTSQPLWNKVVEDHARSPMYQLTASQYVMQPALRALSACCKNIS